MWAAPPLISLTAFNKTEVTAVSYQFRSANQNSPARYSHLFIYVWRPNCLPCSSSPTWSGCMCVPWHHKTYILLSTPSPLYQLSPHNTSQRRTGRFTSSYLHVSLSSLLFCFRNVQLRFSDRMSYATFVGFRYCGTARMKLKKPFSSGRYAHFFSGRVKNWSFRKKDQFLSLDAF